MSKRNLKIIETEESKLLKEMRKEAGLSVRKLAELMGISHTRVYQMESGREDISYEYLNKFNQVLQLDSKDEYNCTETRVFEPMRESKNNNTKNDLVGDCIAILASMDQEKLLTVKTIIERL
tara:strand:- start:7314 stop:7679 length:366 start_codon:yes stop_codon:yes gene_type:complete